MPKIFYADRKFGPAALKLIATAEAICNEYARQGYSLSLRQLYYQFVSRDIIPNRQSEYKRLGDIVGDARLAGLIDWDHLEDRGRSIEQQGTWGSGGDILYSAAYGYREDKWRSQPRRVYVLIEKDALSGVFNPVCQRLQVPLFACKGYASLSSLWELGRRFREHIVNGDQEPLVLHFGDHDPSGIDMSRDLEERLSLFAEKPVEVIRLALNMDQVARYGPPPNPAKLTDSRAQSYIAEYGTESWELDALNPTVLGRLVEDTVLRYRDEELWNEAVEGERRERETLQRLQSEWADVKRYINGKGE